MQTASPSPETRALEHLVRGYDAAILARARIYVAEGRVTLLPAADDCIVADVHGTKHYRVSLAGISSRDAFVDCSCPAFVREEQCKHVAAVVHVLSSSANKSAAPVERLPDVLRNVHSSGAFLPRLSLYAGQPLGQDLPRWETMASFWHRQSTRTADADAHLRASVFAHADAIAKDLATLRTWTPPTPRPSGTAFDALCASLAARYLECRDDLILRRTPPGPIDDARHPGFDVVYEAKRRRVVVRERASKLLRNPLELAFIVPLEAPGEPRFENDAVNPSTAVEAWELFALRALLLALAARTDDATRALEQDLTRPTWEHVLERLTHPAASESKTYGFCIASTYSPDVYHLLLFGKPAHAGKRTQKWKREGFEALYAEDVSPLEREIARIASCALERPNEANLVLGTPQGHELLRALARHPRVHLSESKRPNPDEDPRIEIVVGDVTMRLEPSPNGMLAPRFMVGTKEIGATMLGGHRPSPFRGIVRGGLLGSAFVPPALRSWVSMAAAMDGGLSFPPEATSKLVATTEPLLSSGVAEVPRHALGAELRYDPAPAIRVEWHPEGAAVLEIFVAVHPGAPLVAPGRGPVLFTFERSGKRVFVERDLAREVTLAQDAQTQITAPIVWDGAVGRTESLEEALALAAWLDRNPLGLAIEVTLGKTPRFTMWENGKGNFEVRREGSWLVLDGGLDVAGAKLTVGDVLEAVRLARRFVKAGDGTFLALSEAAVEKLTPIAMASELAPGGDSESVCVHEAFGAVLADAQDVLGRTRGVDLGAYAERLRSKKGRIAVPALDRGKLRPYQRDGVAWMLRLATWAPGCVLADDMGLGKTIQTAAVLKARATRGPALIVAPASVSSNWIAELARFMPSLRTRWFNDERDVLPAELGPSDVLVVSYGLLQRNSDHFKSQTWATLVIDEAQYVKNVSAQRTDAVRSLPREFTIALTGTPLENHLGELFSIVDLAFSGLLGDEQTFRERFRRPIEGRGDADRLAILSRLLAPFLLRRTRADVLRELPPREEITLSLDLAPDEQKRYLALRRACEQQFAKRKSGETAAQLKIALFAALTRLRQLACDVRLVDPAFRGTTTKITRTVELVTELAGEGNRALVFSQFTQFLERIRDALTAAGLRVAYLAGDTPTTKRRQIVEAFQSGEYDVFCVSLLAGGTGLNLTKASYVIHTDPWWNPAAEEQATSRAHRMGQTDPVTVYRLVARGTIEEAVLAMHGTKKKLAEAVLDGKASTQAITASDLLALLRFGG